MYRQRYEREEKVVSPSESLQVSDTKQKRTRRSVFLPDKEMFEETVFDFDTLRRETSVRWHFWHKGNGGRITSRFKELEEPKIRAFRRCAGGVEDACRTI